MLLSMDHTASAPRLLLIKSLPTKIAHQAGYALYGGRWHKVHEHKPAPKGAPVAAHPTAAGVHGPFALTDAQIEQLKYPADKAATNPEMKAFNEKHLPQLLAHAANGDATAIVGSKYGTNSHSKKQVAVANFLLEQMGSQHKVAAGQGAGWHSAVEHAVEPVQAAEPAPAAPATAGMKFGDWAEAAAANEEAAPADPAFDPQYKATPFFEKAAAHLKALHQAGDMDALAQAKDDSAAWAGKSPNSKILLAYHAELMAAAPAAAAAAVAPAPAPAVDADTADKQHIDDMVSVGDWEAIDHAASTVDAYSAPVMAHLQDALKKKPAPPPDAAPAPPAPPAGNALLAQIPWDTYVLPDTNTNAGSFNKKLAQVKALADAGDVAGLEAMSFGVNTYGKKGKLIAQAAIAALKEGAPAAPAAPAPEPVAASPAAVSPPTYPEGLTGYEFNADDIAAALEQGDLAALKEQLTALDSSAPAKSNVGKVAAYAQQAIAYLEQKAGIAGPKEGDQKQGADGMLVLKDGHWVKVDAPEPAPAPAAAPATLADVDIPDFLAIAPDKYGKGYALVATALKVAAIEKGAAGVKALIVQHKDGTISVKAAGWHLKHIPPDGGAGNDAAKARRVAMHKFITDLLGAAGKAPKVKPTAASTAPAAAPVPPAPTIPSMDAWTQTGPQGGSNPGGKFKAPDGTEYYCKFPANEDVAKSEVLAAKLYAAAGLAGQDAMLITKDGKVGIASKWSVVKKASSTGALSKAPDAQGGFAVDAWLGNWDVVGLGYDNLQLGADGKAVRVDAGGSLEYRAQGGKKPFPSTVDEIETLRDQAKNPQAAAVFGSMTKADITASVAKVAAISDTDIKSLVQQFGPGTAADKAALAATLIARKADLLAKYPKAALAVAKGASWVRLKPGESVVEAGEKFGVHWAKIKVPSKGFHAESIAAPPNFFLNGSQGPDGLWKSSVKHVNEANNEAGQAIYDTAIAAKRPEPVQAMLFDQIDKATGNKTGTKLSYAQHPAGEIKEYFNQVAAELEAQTKATFKTVQNGSFTQSYSAAALSMAADFTPVDYAKFKTHAAKAADYLVLSQSAAAGLPVPDKGIFEEQWENVSPKLIAFKEACSAKFDTLSSSEQTACKSYTGSSYANWNQALRAGDMASSSWQSAQPMVKAFAKAAMDIPEGTILWRGLGVGEDTYKSVTGAVIQDGSFQSTSFGSAPAFGSYKTWLKIHVGKGVKGLHATSFSKFGSGEREIIVKNNVRYAVLSVTHHDNFVDSKGKSHGQKTIVDLLALPHED